MRVWAPKAKSVRIKLGRGSEHEGVRGDDDHFLLEPPAPGEDYSLSVDGGAWRPDPRSPWQPHGVHGPSRAVALATPAPFTPPPLGLVYELHVGTFSPEGTFDGAAARLDHLVALGVTHVELMPIAEFPGRWGWGYDGVCPFAVRDAYGGPAGLSRFVEAAHGKGLAVVLDVVYNHLGPDGNYLGQFGPYFTARHQTPWGDAVNLDAPGSDVVRRYFIENALQWLDAYRFDGLRLDAVHALVDDTAYPFLEELADAVHRLGRPIALIAETDRNDPRTVADGAMTAHWNDDFHHAVHALLTGERHGYYVDFGSFAELAHVLHHGYRHDGRYSKFRDRRHGRPYGDLPRERLIGFAQSHDQVGNRARGERLIALVGPARAKIAAALTYVAPFTPMLFQGEEWGAGTPFAYFVDHQSPELAHAVREGRRREFPQAADPYDPQDEATFRLSCLDWDEPTRAAHADLLAWHRALAALRRDLRGLPIVTFDEAAQWMTVAREGTTLVFHLGQGTLTLPVRGQIQLAHGEATVAEGQLTLGPDACAIVR
jgi:maltooligosyltrehalose trehalohydrolase